MNVRFNAEEISRAYGQAFRRLQQLPGFDQPTLLKAEAGVILKTWAGRTPVATQNTTDLRSRLKSIRAMGYTKAENSGDVTINAGVRGQPGLVWIKVRRGGGKSSYRLTGSVSPNGGSYTDRGIKWSSKFRTSTNQATQNYGSKTPTAVRLGRQSIGLARQSVIQIADDLGIDLTSVKGGSLSVAGINRARAAIASSGRSYKNGYGRQTGDDQRVSIDLFTRLPYGGRIGMAGIIQQIVLGRAKYVETSYRKGAFSSMDRVAKAFPNLIKFSQ